MERSISCASGDPGVAIRDSITDPSRYSDTEPGNASSGVSTENSVSSDQRPSWIARKTSKCSPMKEYNPKSASLNLRSAEAGSVFSSDSRLLNTRPTYVAPAYTRRWACNSERPSGNGSARGPGNRLINSQRPLSPQNWPPNARRQLRPTRGRGQSTPWMRTIMGTLVAVDRPNRRKVTLRAAIDLRAAGKARTIQHRRRRSAGADRACRLA
jgi:hypothetical protein